MALVRSVVAHGIATVTLDSPSNRNALSSALITELGNPLNPLFDDDGTADGIRRFNFHRLQGDFDGDAAVTIADRTSFMTHFGSVAGQLDYNFAFDLNGDGVINITDYLLWTRLIGRTV